MLMHLYHIKFTVYHPNRKLSKQVKEINKGGYNEDEAITKLLYDYKDVDIKICIHDIYSKKSYNCQVENIIFNENWMNNPPP